MKVFMDPEYECAICLCDIKKDETKLSLSYCGHKYHHECVSQLFTKQKPFFIQNKKIQPAYFLQNSQSQFSCPMCRRKYCWNDAEKEFLPLIAIIHFRHNIVHPVYHIDELMTYITDSEKKTNQYLQSIAVEFRFGNLYDKLFEKNEHLLKTTSEAPEQCFVRRKQNEPDFVLVQCDEFKEELIQNYSCSLLFEMTNFLRGYAL